MDEIIKDKVETEAIAYQNLKAEQDDIERQIKELQARKNALADKAETLKENIKFYLDGKTFKSNFCEVSYGRSKSVMIDDIKAIPEKFLEILDPKPDKKAIKAAIESGEKVSGVHIETSTFMKISFK